MQKKKEIAGERIWVEFKQIIIGRFADSLMKHMIETNVAKYLGFEQDLNLTEFSQLHKLYENETDNKVKPMPITMICSLLKNSNQV